MIHLTGELVWTCWGIAVAVDFGGKEFIMQFGPFVFLGTIE